MKKGWVKRSIDDICVFRGGGTPSKSQERFWKGDIPWVSPKDMKTDVVTDSIDHISADPIQQSTTNLIPAGSILVVVRSGILARTIPVAITGRDVTINQDIKALCPDSSVDAWFLFYFLKSRLEEMLSLASRGATVHRIMADQIRAMEILVPPLPEQKRIVGILDEAFAGIATAKANAEKNLQNARALFESHLHSVFTHRGDGWVESTLGETLAVLRNGFNCKQDKSGKGQKISRIESIWNAKFDLNRVGYAELPEDQQAKFRLQKGDVLVSHINSAIHVGKTALFDVDEEVFHGVNLLLMRPKPKVLSEYLDLYLKFIFARGYWLRVCKQSINQASVNQQDINRVPIRFPNIKRQATIVDQMDSLREKTQHLESIYERKLVALEALKKSLLHQAFNGEL